MCTCEGCGQPYNPNRHKKCGTQGCDTLFSHHPHYYKQLKKSKDSAETDKETEKLTHEKLKKKVDSIRWRRVLQDSRGEASERMATETNPVEVVDILCRWSTTASQDVTFNRPSIPDYTAALAYDICLKSSKALYGSVSKGRASIWQFLPLTGAWKSTWYHFNHVLTGKHPMVATDIAALGTTPVEIKTFI